METKDNKYTLCVLNYFIFTNFEKAFQNIIHFIIFNLDIVNKMEHF